MFGARALRGDERVGLFSGRRLFFAECVRIIPPTSGSSFFAQRGNPPGGGAEVEAATTHTWHSVSGNVANEFRAFFSASMGVELHKPTRAVTQARLVASIMLLIAAGVIAVLFIVLLAYYKAAYVLEVPTGYVAAVVRLGKYCPPMRGPGLLCLEPFTERVRGMTWTENRERINANGALEQHQLERKHMFIPTTLQVYDPPGISVVTADRVSIDVNLVIEWSYVDVEVACFKCDRPFDSMWNAVYTSVVNYYAQVPMNEVYGNTDNLSRQIVHDCKDLPGRAGIQVHNVRIQEIEVPDAIRDKMNAMQALAVEREAEARQAEAAQSKAKREHTEHVLRIEREAAIARMHHTQQLALVEGEAIRQKKAVEERLMRERMETEARLENERLQAECRDRIEARHLELQRQHESERMAHGCEEVDASRDLCEGTE